MIVDLPFDILHLIANQVGSLSHPLAYTIDATSLYALCLVSRSFNAAAIPVLYSSITLRSQHSADRLAMTASSNPALLKWCHSLRCPQWRLRFVGDTILSSMTGLRRLLTAQKSWCSSEFLLGSTILELAFLALHEPFRKDHKFYKFPNLERLVVNPISRMDRPHEVDNFPKLPRLTHLAIAGFDPICLGPDMIEYLDALTKVIKHTPQLRRLILGQVMECEKTLHFDGFRNRLRERLPEGRDVHIIFLGCDRSFADRIVDGTLWEMPSFV